MAEPAGMPDLEAALRLFDETVRALEARARRLEEVLTVKQGELTEANRRLGEKVSELNALSRYLELVLSSVASGVIAVNERGRITTVNPAARRIYAGLGRSLEGAVLPEIFPDSVVPTILSGNRHGIDRGLRAGQRQVPGPDGRPRQLEIVASPIVSPEGHIVGAVEVADDVTEVQGLRQQLERAERLKSLGEMAAGVAHEIRNPLNGIAGFASLLSRDLEPGSRSARHAQAIISGVRDLNRTVSSLLEFTRQRPPEMQPVVVAQVIEDSLALLEAEAAAGSHDQPADLNASNVSIAFTRDFHCPDLVLSCDSAQLRQVLLNLLHNAATALREAERSGEIRVSLDQIIEDNNQPWCLIEVADSGPGIPEELWRDIFTPFFTTRAQGTGLGLAIVHTIIQLHGGRISVETDPALGGAHFRILMPLSPLPLPP